MKLVKFRIVLVTDLSVLFLVSLVPSGNVTVCPNERPKFVCRTTGGPLLWETTLPAGAVGNLIEDTTITNSILGIFRLSVLDVRKEGNTTVEVNSTATTLIGLRPEDDNTTLRCFLATTFIRNEVTLKVTGMAHYTVLLARSIDTITLRVFECACVS